MGEQLDEAVAEAAAALNEADGEVGVSPAPKPRWIGRYQTLVLSSAVVSHVGYVVHLE